MSRTTKILMILCLATFGQGHVAADTGQTEDGLEVLQNHAGATTGYILSSGVNFGSGSSALSASSVKAIQKVYKRLADNKNLKVDIRGHADASESNVADLTKARAQGVRDNIVGLGLDSSRISQAVGLGSEFPIGDNATAEGRQQNRRVELILTGADQVAPSMEARESKGGAAQATEQATPEAKASSVAEVTAQKTPATEEKAESKTYRRFAIGVGYPDLRLRAAVTDTVDLEAKFAFNEGIQIYSARLYWNFMDIGPLKATVGGEGGWARFDGIETLGGNGVVTSAFVGLEYPFAKYFRVTADVGPAWLQATADDKTYSATDWVVNTALYFYFF